MKDAAPEGNKQKKWYSIEQTLKALEREEVQNAGGEAVVGTFRKGSQTKPLRKRHHLEEVRMEPCACMGRGLGNRAVTAVAALGPTVEQSAGELAGHKSEGLKARP